MLSRTFGGSVQAITDVMVSKFQTAKEANSDYVRSQYTEDGSDIVDQISACDPKSLLCINIVKLIYEERTG